MQPPTPHDCVGSAESRPTPKATRCLCCCTPGGSRASLYSWRRPPHPTGGCSGASPYCRHPNYLVVIAEIATLPLAFGALAIAATFSALNLVLIARRIRIEERVLAPRRAV